MSILERGADALADRFGMELERVRAEIRGGLQETRNALRITGARNHPIQPNARNANGAGRLVGWSLRETGGAAGAVVTVYDGMDAAADVLAVLVLAAGAGSMQAPAAPGVSYGDGVYVAVTAPPGAGAAGTVVGSLYFGAVD